MPGTADASEEPSSEEKSCGKERVVSTPGLPDQLLCQAAATRQGLLTVLDRV